MPNTVTCPECQHPATVLDRFTLAASGGPVEYLRLRCDGPLTFLVAATEIRRPGGPARLSAGS